MSGGNAGTYLANVGAASASKFKRMQQVNNTEADRKVNIQNANTELENNAQLTNLNLNNQYDDLDLRNKGAKQEILATGLSQLSSYGQTKAIERGLRKNDEIMMENLETSQYKVDPKTKKVVKKAKGTSGIKTKFKSMKKGC
jgi:hypothetical protein